MGSTAPILIVGTADTKSDEIRFLQSCIERLDCSATAMDVSVLGEPKCTVAYSKHDVAAAAGSSIDSVIASGDENSAMTLMADGAAKLTRRLYDEGGISAMIALGGSMGTDLALDVALELPLGVPKFIVSTIAFSHLIPPQRLAPDLMMILWAGGLYGLNSISRSILSQAAGAVCGAARYGALPDRHKPKVGITSFGKSAARWMVRLVPELEQRGFEAAVFHATGMGGRAFEALAAQGEFCAVMDFATQEVTNDAFASVVTAGPDRLTGAGLAGVPQIVAPGFIDLVDLPGWQPFPADLAGREHHAHNRLISSISLNADERRDVVAILAAKLAQAKGPTTFVLPTQGVQEWDRPGGPLRNPKAIEAVNAECRRLIREPVELIEIDAHINDDRFVDTALAVFDRWVEQGIVSKTP
jgi:uncharacterized protein (UPF0261 family)